MNPDDLFINRSGDEFQDTCTMLGLMVLSWAWAENCLAMTLGVINKYSGPIKGHRKPPLPMQSRILCLEAALVQIPALHDLKQCGSALATRFTELSNRRNDFVHGAAWQIQEGEYESSSVAVNAGQNVLKNHRFNKNDAILLNTEIAKLSDDAKTFMFLVCDVFRDKTP